MSQVEQVNRRDYATRNEYMTARAHTRAGVLRVIYFSQVNTSQHRGHKPPAYSLDEFRNRFVNDPLYIKLYTAWVESGKQKDLKPSFDRIDESRGYSFDNIQLVTWEQNYRRHVSDVRRTVVLFAGENLVGIFDSVQAAREAMGNRSNSVVRRYLDTGKATQSGHYIYSVPESLVPKGVMCR